MKTFSCILSLLLLVVYINATSIRLQEPTDHECLAFPCAPPPCDNPRPTTVIQNGKECPGCPVCPPDDDCASLDSCTESGSCPPFFCQSCGFENNQFCKCGDCTTCDNVDCPQPSAGCTNFEPLRVAAEDCDNCDICVDDFRPCPEISCLALPPGCPEEQIRNNPIHLNGRICLGCASCACPDLNCQECDEVDPEWEPVLDSNGCQTNCPACKVTQNGMCALIRCGLPSPHCQTLSNFRGPDGEVCTSCFSCADDLEVCSQFSDCPELPDDCENKPLHDVVEINGASCLSCPVCSRIPKCEPRACPACAPPQGWVQPVDNYGCPIGCPPCRPVCPEVDCLECDKVDPNWTPVFDNNGCQTNCPACKVSSGGICARIFCIRPEPTCNQLSYLRGEDGEVCSGCINCVDDKNVCQEFDCPDLPDDCDNKPLYDLVKVNNRECLSCPVCSRIAQCQPLICPACVTVDDFVSPVDENGCPTQCAPCTVDELPLCPWWNRLRCRPNQYENIRTTYKSCRGCSHRHY